MKKIIIPLSIIFLASSHIAHADIPFQPTVMNAYVGLMAVIAIFFFQLFVFFILMWLVVITIGYPIKRFIKSINAIMKIK